MKKSSSNFKMFKVFLLLFYISYGKLELASAESMCLKAKGGLLPLKEVEYFSLSSSAKAIEDWPLPYSNYNLSFFIKNN